MLVQAKYGEIVVFLPQVNKQEMVILAELVYFPLYAAYTLGKILG